MNKNQENVSLTAHGGLGDHFSRESEIVRYFYEFDIKMNELTKLISKTLKEVGGYIVGMVEGDHLLEFDFEAGLVQLTVQG